MVGFLKCLENEFAFSFCGRDTQRQHDLRRRFRPGMPQIRRQVECFNPLALSKNQRPFHDVPELANVPWPGVRHEHLHGVIAKRFNTGSMLSVELSYEMLGQQRNVFLAIAKWRKVYGED